MQKFTTKSEEETKKIAAKIAKRSKSQIFALTGELGTGKTIFAQGFAKGLGIKEKIISPTFILIRIHKIPKTEKLLYHIDLYRLEDNRQFNALGIEEILNDSNHFILIEWAEKIKELLPKNTCWISIRRINETIREISINF